MEQVRSFIVYSCKSFLVLTSQPLISTNPNQNWNTPMLIIHSDTDYRCPITEGLAAFNVCQMRGVPSRFLNFPDENHFVLKKPNSLQWYHSVLGWINHYAGVEGTVELKPALTRGAWRKGGGR